MVETSGSFDFNKTPLKIWTIWPSMPVPLEVSIYGRCGCGCLYCFANLNRDAARRRSNYINPIEKLLEKMSRDMSAEYSPIGYFLRNKYPICLSNTTDPFQPIERKYRASLGFLKWAAAMKHPLAIQTKGGILADPEEFERYAPLVHKGKDTVYITITTLDDGQARRIEPGSPPPSERLKLAEKFAARGVPVSVGLNPYVAAWLPDKAAYCKALSNAGVKGIWFEYLHLSKKQVKVLPEAFAEYKAYANLAEDYVAVFPELKEWYLAAREHGLIFYPDMYIDAWMGYVSPFADCHSAEDYGPGARLFTYTGDFMRLVQDVSHDGPAFTGDLEYRPGQKVLIRWANIEAFLRLSGLENPLFDTNDFWLPYNLKLKADRHAWNHILGKRARFYDILRYFWNHPHENAQLCWDNPLLQVLEDFTRNIWIIDDDKNVQAVYNPDVRFESPIPEAYDYNRYEKRKYELIHLQLK